MTVQEMAEKAESLARSRPQEWPGGEALHAGLTLILTEAARAHVEKGDLETATLCVVEAERCLAYLRSQQPIAHEW